MAKGYVIVDIHVRDEEGFEKFREMAKPVLEEYGAKVLTGLKVFLFLFHYSAYKTGVIL